MTNAHDGSRAPGPLSTDVALDPTGVPNLDEVLGGGVPRGSLLLVVGPPGSGKTTLANQMAFVAARAGRAVLILTALSESTSKLLDHLRAFQFFDESLIGGPVQIMSLEQFLPRGLTATKDELLTMARDAEAGLVVLDGFRGVRGADSDPQQARQFLYDLGSTLSIHGTTTLVTSEVDPRDPAFFPEATTADVIVGLHYTLSGVRQRRGIEAIKTRGTQPLPGLHGLTLTDDGAVVYPRLEARVVASAPTIAPENVTPAPASLGVVELDALLGGGVTRNTVTLVAGSLGTGKTLLGLHFALAGVQDGEPVLFLGFRETADQLVLKARVATEEEALRQALAPRGRLTLLHLPPVELDPDVVADQLLAVLDRSGARRLVIDSLAELERAVRAAGNGYRVDEYLAALVVTLRSRGITTLIIKETRRVIGDETEYSAETTGMLVDNVILLEQLVDGDTLQRMLSIVKMRYSAHDAKRHAFVITPPHGIRLQAIHPDEGAVDTTPGS
jgi:circadian clock protein KaiC